MFVLSYHEGVKRLQQHVYKLRCTPILRLQTVLGLHQRNPLTNAFRRLAIGQGSCPIVDETSVSEFR